MPPTSTPNAGDPGTRTRTPDFLIIGAPKCGTTSLYQYLSQHPQLWMTPLKEPHWFLFDGPKEPLMNGPGDKVRRREMVRSWGAYQALLAQCPPGRVCGEASVRYLYSTQACEAIHRRCPHARLIVLLRHPAERAYSAYVRDRVFGLETCPTFAEALDDGPRREREGWFRGSHQSLGYYGRDLAPWYATFESAQIRVYLFEDLVHDPAALMCDLFAFLGVRPEFQPNLSQRFAVTGPIANPFLRVLWRDTRTLRSHVAPLVPMWLRGRRTFDVGRLRVRKSKAPPLEPALRERLTAAYRDDILALQALIGRDLSHWLASPAP